MKTCSKCLKLKDKTFFYKRSASKDGLTPLCKECQNIKNNIWKFNNKDKSLAIGQKWRKNNPEKQRKSEQEYKKNNPEKRSESVLRYIQANKEKISQYMAKYQKKNKFRLNSNTALRRSKKVQATPIWANLDLIKEYYQTADGLSMITGEWYEVDHIVPLNSKLVCGLHCEANLRVITQFENQSKNNRYWENMP